MSWYASCFGACMSNQPSTPRPAGTPKQEMTKTPGKDDLHEQREPDQQEEAVVSVPEPAPSSPQV